MPPTHETSGPLLSILPRAVWHGHILSRLPDVDFVSLRRVNHELRDVVDNAPRSMWERAIERVPLCPLTAVPATPGGMMTLDPSLSQNASEPIFSPSGAYMSLKSRGKETLFDCMTGRPLLSAPSTKSLFTKCAWSEDESRLWFGQRVYYFDTKPSKLTWRRRISGQIARWSRRVTDYALSPHITRGTSVVKHLVAFVTLPLVILGHWLYGTPKVRREAA